MQPHILRSFPPKKYVCIRSVRVHEIRPLGTRSKVLKTGHVALLRQKSQNERNCSIEYNAQYSRVHVLTSERSTTYPARNPPRFPLSIATMIPSSPHLPRPCQTLVVLTNNHRHRNLSTHVHAPEHTPSIEGTGAHAFKPPTPPIQSSPCRMLTQNQILAQMLPFPSPLEDPLMLPVSHWTKVLMKMQIAEGQHLRGLRRGNPKLRVRVSPAASLPR